VSVDGFEDHTDAEDQATDCHCSTPPVKIGQGPDDETTGKGACLLNAHSDGANVRFLGRSNAKGVLKGGKGEYTTWDF
jgi:hypothetical protein